MTKEEIRLMLRGRKVSRACSDTVLGKLMTNERFFNASTILLYYPLDDEVDVRPLLNCTKKTALPYIERGKMEFSLYTGDLVKGAFGVMECRNRIPVADSSGQIFADQTARFPEFRSPLFHQRTMDRTGPRE